mmetsp:Transcript_31246/g.47682  ORF Transcript_31246/g.47682 Transcript_31246/m.47682 type:complete len:143 (+) Transcript_31246:531-959(+)
MNLEMGIKKHLSVLERLLLRDHMAAFPSGDAAGVMAVTFPLLCGQHRNIPFAVVCLVLSCLGRLYWKAHHLSDVLVGAALSFCCCTFLNQWIGKGICQVEWRQTALTWFTFIIVASLWRRYYELKTSGSSSSTKTHSSKRSS